MIKILLADDHAVLRQGLRLIVQTDPDLQVVGEATTGVEAIELVTTLQPDILITDINMPDMTGLEAARRLRSLCPQTCIIVLTVSDRTEDLLEAFKAGVRGYLLKSAQSQEVLAAIHRVAEGETILPPKLATRLLAELAQPTPTPEALTEREQDVLRFMAQGVSNKEIAAALNISENTTKTHVRHILAKLNLRSRAEAAAYATRLGLANNC
jgi:DNA-binding NarL/FixJ family response regulator